MKSYFRDDLIHYDLLSEEESNFDTADMVVDKIKARYPTELTSHIEGFDSYFIEATIHKKYNICVAQNVMAGLTIFSENEQSNDMVTEIANYLEKEVFKKQSR